MQTSLPDAPGLRHRLSRLWARRARIGRGRPAGDQHDLAAHAAPAGAVRQQQCVAPAQLDRLTVLGLERPVTLQDHEDREAGVDLGLQSRRDALGTEERVSLAWQEGGDRAVGRRSAQRGQLDSRAVDAFERTLPAEAERGLVRVVDAEALPLEQNREVGRLLQLDDQ